MSQVYDPSEGTHTLQAVGLTAGERSTGMTTEESYRHMDTSLDNVTEKKPSFFGKVKAKAKDKVRKLKGKVKPGSQSESATGEKHADDSGSFSESDDDEDSQETPYTTLSNALPEGHDSASSGFEGNSPDITHENRKFGLLDSPESSKVGLGGEAPSAESPSATASAAVPLSQYKSDGPPGVEQAVPTEYNYFNRDPAAAMSTDSVTKLSDESREHVPAVGGEQFTGITPLLSTSKAFGTGVDSSYSPHHSGNLEEGAAKIPFESSDGSFSDSRRSESRNSVREGAIVTPHNSLTGSNQKYNSLDESENKSGPLKNQDAGRGFSYGSNAGVPLKNQDSGSGFSYGQNAGVPLPETREATDSWTGPKDAELEDFRESSNKEQQSSFDYSASSEQKPVHQRAYEGLTDAAAGLGQQVGMYKDYDSSAGGPDHSSGTEPSSTYDANQSGEQGKTWSQWVADNVNYTKGKITEAAPSLGPGSETPGQTENSIVTPSGDSYSHKPQDSIVGSIEKAPGDVDYSTNSATNTNTTPQGQTAYDAFVGTKNHAAETAGVPEGQSYAQKAYDTILGRNAGAGAEDSKSGTTDIDYDRSLNSSKAPTVETSDQNSTTQKMLESGMRWKDSIASSIGLGSSTAAGDRVDNPPHTARSTSSTDQKSQTENLMDTAVRVKDTVASKLGYAAGTPTNSPDSSSIFGESKPTTERVTQTTGSTGLNDWAGNKPSEPDQSLPSEPKPVAQKAADSVHQTKDAFVARVNPDEHDKDLAQIVTESVGNLPTLLTQKLGFGTTTTSVPTNAPPSGLLEPSSDVPVSQQLDSNFGANITTSNPQSSPTVVSRVTDAVSSFFGGAKKPVNDGEEYTPTSSPTGAHMRLSASTPLGADSATGPRSSPAA